MCSVSGRVESPFPHALKAETYLAFARKVTWAFEAEKGYRTLIYLSFARKPAKPMRTNKCTFAPPGNPRKMGMAGQYTGDDFESNRAIEDT